MIELDGYLNANGKGEIADTVVISPNVERLDIFASKVTSNLLSVVQTRGSTLKGPKGHCGKPHSRS